LVLLPLQRVASCHVADVLWFNPAEMDFCVAPSASYQV
jgi:hypothetical protein